MICSRQYLIHILAMNVFAIMLLFTSESFAMFLKSFLKSISTQSLIIGIHFYKPIWKVFLEFVDIVMKEALVLYCTLPWWLGKGLYCVQSSLDGDVLCQILYIQTHGLQKKMTNVLLALLLVSGSFMSWVPIVHCHSRLKWTRWPRALGSLEHHCPCHHHQLTNDYKHKYIVHGETPFTKISFFTVNLMCLTSIIYQPSEVITIHSRDNQETTNMRLDVIIQ